MRCRHFGGTLSEADLAAHKTIVQALLRVAGARYGLHATSNVPGCIAQHGGWGDEPPPVNFRLRLLDHVAIELTEAGIWHIAPMSGRVLRAF